jgi:predicted lipoprotein with Yx(FWY)xxD motif
MSGAQEQQVGRSSGRRRPSGLVLAIAAVPLVLAALFAAMALASGDSPIATSTSNAKLGKQITVDAHGRTLYELSPETARHLLCKSRECMRFWPPLTVRSSNTKLKAGAGVHGHLAILRRSNGVLQVTLGERPLYRYSGDGAKGEANGQHIHSFGGIWHVVSATTSASPAPRTPTMPAAPTPTPGYGY